MLSAMLSAAVLAKAAMAAKLLSTADVGAKSHLCSNANDQGESGPSSNIVNNCEACDCGAGAPKEPFRFWDEMGDEVFPTWPDHLA